MTEQDEKDFEIPEDIRRQFDFLMKAGSTGDIAVMSLEGAEDEDMHYVLVHVYYAEEGVEIYPIGEIYTPQDAMSRFKPAEGMHDQLHVDMPPEDSGEEE